MTKRPVYYPISALTRDHFGVLFPIGPIRLRSGELIAAAEVQGFRKTYRKGQPTERVVYRVRLPDGRTEDLPPFLTPTLFRPADLSRYPDPLPLPATLTGDVNWGSEHPPQEPPDEPDELAWPGAYNPPGKITEKEAEVRLLRAWKTQSVSDVDGHGLGGPEGYRTGRGFGRDVEVRGGGWEPTRQDIGDWPVAMHWYTRLRNTDHQKVIRLRALDYSFRQIGERIRKGIKPASAFEWARTTYRRAISELTVIANRRRATF